MQLIEHALRQSFAADAVEGECVADGRADMLLEGAAQDPASAMHTRLHRLGPQVKQLRGFLDAQAFDDARDEDGTKRIWQLVDRAYAFEEVPFHGSGQVGRVNYVWLRTPETQERYRNCSW